MNHRVSAVTYDTIIRGGLWFDGTGAEPAVRDLGILGGRVAAVSATPLKAGPDTEVVEAAGRWVMPGMVDIHTHYDVEVLEGPGLSESLRHGVTTLLLGSCSLSTVHVDPVDAGDASAEPERDPRFWHRDHPVFTPLAGFFTGLLVAVAVPGVFGALLSSFLDDESVARVFPFTLAVVGVPLVLLAVPRTRRFGKYMLFGMVLTAVVVVAVAALTLWILISNDG